VASGALELSKAFSAAVKKYGLEGEVQVIETGCLGPCAAGPVAAVYPDGILYQNLKTADADTIAQEHLLKGRVVSSLTYKTRDAEPEEVWVKASGLREIPFFNKQVKIVLRNCGLIDPLKIEEYIARDGYMALAKALTRMKPEEVIAEVKASGLRGRGGAGFSTGMKWELTRKAAGTEKFVLCNADEGDPGAFMDRSVLEGDPHSLIEAMTIAGYAIGSFQGYVYVRAEYPLAVARLGKALEQARAMGLLGANIMGTGFSFDLEIRMGSGAFVCGEETALMTSIEGNRGEPRPRPPFPANKGLWGKPSLLNNVETYAAVPVVILKGAPWYASMGTPKSKGTKVFALAGAVRNTGLVEIPIGMPLGEIIYDIGGGMREGKTYKAAQIGGPSGGCIPRHHLNVPVDYESLNELGAIMGSGGLIVMDDDTCMVDIARFFLDFVQDESCGKCTPCRIGTKRMLEILNRICEGKGEEGDIERLIDLGNTIKDTALCGLGQTAPNPVLSAIRHFREEFVEHIRDRKCRAGVCPELVRAPCQNACPAGVDVPGFISLTGEKRYAEALALHREKNPFVAVCARVCFHPCEGKCRRSTLDDPLSIRSIKRFLSDQEDGIKLPASVANPANAKRKVAVVGAGPAGLSCAYFLARLGYTPVVYEAEDKPGGMLLQAIPSYRLPRNVLAKEIKMIQGMGVTIKTGKRLGKDFTLKTLKDQGFEAVFLGVGAPRGMGLGMKGDDAKGVTEAIEFLKQFNLTGRAPVGKNVLVVGGGNAAVDAARTALRLGAKSVTVAYRRTRAEMPAYAEEVEEAEREGVRFEMLVAPAELIVDKGALKAVKMTRMSLGEFDRTGRRKPVSGGAAGTFTLEVDQLIAAVGQTLNPAELFNGVSVKLTEREYLAADPVTGKTSVEWVFAGGDAATGPASVVEAIAAGEKAAVGIDGYLNRATRAPWRVTRLADTFFDPDADPVLVDRAQDRLIPVAKRKGFTEVETTWAASIALTETKRCLRCDWREGCASVPGNDAAAKASGNNGAAKATAAKKAAAARTKKSGATKAKAKGGETAAAKR
jgi:NADH-quinone oxidoreductase subunit F